MKLFDSGKPWIMGILNVTPDSFSDGGLFVENKKAIDHALRMVEEGAVIIDIGGESTRPGSSRISAAEQQKRILPVLVELRKKIPDEILISVDTTRAEVAQAALDNGANIINDISAGRDDPGIMDLASKSGCPYIIMHMQAEPATMQDNPCYTNVVEEVRSFLLERAEVARQQGIDKENIVIDPGIGFGKTTEHNLEIMENLDRFVDTGYPVLLGASRKRFIGTICKNTSPDKLVGATCATTVIGVAAGVKIFRVHDVRENRQAADVAWSILRNSE